MDYYGLNHRVQVMHICVNKLNIIGSDNGLSPGQQQAIIWTNVGILLIGPLETNFNETLIKIYIFPFIQCIWKCRQEIGGLFFPPLMC